jgi:hypothetical protein
MIYASKLISLIFPFFLILAQYKLANINMGYILVQGLAAVILISNFKFRVQKHFLVFISSIFVAVIFSMYLYGKMYHGTIFYYLNGILLFLVVIVLSSYIKFSSLYRMLLVVGVFATLLVLIQGVYITVSGSEVAPIKLLPVTADLQRLWVAAPRPSGVFTEPQLYASFILPLFLFAVLKKKFILSFVFMLGILLSGSTYGIIVVFALVVWLVITSGRLTSIKAWMLICSCVFFLAIIFYTTGMFDKSLEKLARTDISQGIRVAKAPMLFLEMSFSEKIFGMESTVGDFISQHINVFPWLLRYLVNDSHLLNYVSGLFSLAIYYGVVPMILFLWMLIMTYIHGDRFQQGMVIVVFLHSLSATFLFNGYFVYYFVLLFANSFDGTSKVRYWSFKQ